MLRILIAAALIGWLLLLDRRERARSVAYHYDPRAHQQRHGSRPRRLGARPHPARPAQQQNGYDCGVFVVDGTRALVSILAQRELPGHEPLHLDNLVANRPALQARLRAATTAVEESHSNA
ncbi:hypothetical protein I6F26_24610 [Ensifer sp. IC3342]|nr:hypothetical protein [Ensifer sp. IC4062]MCA1408182.1 hypothetical protein [Ensifer sp. BRP08]MCA1443810.1 hypothetical protein [Ensifer sp. IC4062]MCA1449752.1 hypothetical protein [Ensifer sp. IC3342]